MSTTGASSPNTGRRRRAGATRALLVDACLDLIRRDGLGGLTTQRVTAAAGISQPGFYKHFENLDALLAEAVGTVMEAMGSQQVAIQLGIHIESEADVPSPEARRQMLESMLAIFLSEPRLAELYLRYRNDPTMFGGAVGRLDRRVLEQATAYYWSVAQTLGTTPGQYERVAIFVEQSLALYYRAAEMLLTGRYDKQVVLDVTNDALVALSDQLEAARKAAIGSE